MLARSAYSFAWHLALPLLVPRLIWRARRQPDYGRHIGERFGILPAKLPTGPIWIHAVSLGETRAAAPLVEALLAARPDQPILLTHMTPTGRSAGEELCTRSSGRVSSLYLPYDLPWAVARFLATVRPRCGLLMETEVWPNLIAACKAHAVPLAMVNARLSARSLSGYRRLSSLTRPAFAGFDLIGAQTEADAERLRQAGGRAVRVSGNLKFDVTPPQAQLALGQQFRTWIGARPVLLFASSREGEEAAVLSAFSHMAREDCLLVLVPRHPQRFDELARQVTEAGLPLQRRSDGGPVAPQTRVWLGDSMGEMFAYYAAADVAMIGGSWLPFGSQNLIEACAVGCPVIVGPHTFNFAEASERAIAAGAALRESDGAAGIASALALIGDEGRRAAMRVAGLEFVAAHRGATARTLALVKQLLSAGCD